MPFKRAQDVLIEMVEKAIEEDQMGDEIWYATGLTMTPQGPTFLVALWIRGAMLDTTLQGILPGLINPLGWTQAEVNRIVAECIEELRKTRSSQLAQANGHAGG